MSGDKGSSKTDTLVKVVLVFFISLLSFSVGTFVGKQVSDSDHRRIALESEYSADRQVASTDESENKISDKEVESLTEEFVNKEKSAREPASAEEGHGDAAHVDHGAKPEVKATAEVAAAAPAGKEGYKSYPKKGETAAHAAPASEDKSHAKAEKAEAAPVKEAAKAAPAKTAPAKSMAKADGASKAAEKVANGKAPTDGAKEERKPQAALPSVASTAVGKYTVQVASYLSEGEAKNHAADLKGKGWQAFYLSADVKGKTYFRVLVGLFDSQGSANTFRAQFMKEANTKNALIQKIVQ